MKKNILTLFVCFIHISGYSQYLIDNGPLTDGIDYVLEGSVWNKTTLTYYIENTSAHVSSTACEEAIYNAFNTWQSNSVLSFTRVYSSDADIKVKWVTGNHGDGHPFDGQYGVLAHAFYPYPSGGSYAGQLHFDDDENWSVNGTGIDVESVALHEIGHLLGISHSTISTAVMYPYYSDIKRELESDDKEAVWDLYGYICSISGPTIPDSSSYYTISNIPSDCSVSWSYSGTTMTTASMTTNSPAQNQCTISNPNKEYIKGTLTATVTRGGNTLITLSKTIHTCPGFSGTYQQEGGDVIAPVGGTTYYDPIPLTAFEDGETFEVNRQLTVTLTSDKFYGASITHSGESVSNWVHNGNTITFKFPRKLNCGLYDITTISGIYNNSNESFLFSVWAKPVLIPLFPYYSPFNIINDGGIFSITLNEDDVDTGSGAVRNVEWDYSVTDVITGQEVASSHVKGNSATFNAIGWASGIYALRIKCDNQVITKKIRIE